MNLEYIQKEIELNSITLLYFSSQNCAVCGDLIFKVKDLFSKDFPDVKQYFIDASSNLEVASSFMVFTAPTILIFIDGKEYIRESKTISIFSLKRDFERLYTLYYKK